MHISLETGGVITQVGAHAGSVLNQDKHSRLVTNILKLQLNSATLLKTFASEIANAVT